MSWELGNPNFHWTHNADATGNKQFKVVFLKTRIVLSELFPRRTCDTNDSSETSLGNSVQRLKIGIRRLESEEDNGGMSQWDVEKLSGVFTV